MKKKIIPIISVVLVIVLLFPIRMNLKDGGSVRYRAVLYEATKIHKLADVEGVKPYIDGFELKLLGMTVYRKVDDIQADNKVTIKRISDDKQAAISEADSHFIKELLSSGKWEEYTSECLNDYEVSVGRQVFFYHSDCGTFNDKANNRHFKLDEDAEKKINAVIAD